MKLVPLQPVFAQQINITLNGQACVITLRQRTTGFFASLVVAGVTLFTEVLCQPRVRLVRQPSLGFIGDLAFVDTQGEDAPSSTDLGTRWLLVYFLPDELPTGLDGVLP